MCGPSAMELMEEWPVSASDVVRAFVELINAHDKDGLIALISPQHVFIDSLGNRFSHAMAREGWEQYFTMVPDYWIRLDEIVRQGDVVIAFGQAGGTFVPSGGNARPENRWGTPAAWRAVVSEGRILEWRVYCDNEPILQHPRGDSLRRRLKLLRKPLAAGRQSHPLRWPRRDDASATPRTEVATRLISEIASGT